LEKIGFAARSKRWLRSWLAKARRQREFRNLAIGDVASIARDLGLSTKELHRAVGAGEGPGVALHRLLDILHLDRQEIARKEPEAYRDLIRVCMQCANSKQCKRGFERSNPPKTWPDYCPNAVTLRALLG